MHRPPINALRFSYFAGFALLTGAGLFLIRRLRHHMQTNHREKWESMITLHCPTDYSLQSSMRARAERTRAINLFLKRKDYLALNDAKLEIICRQLRALNTISIIFFVASFIGAAILIWP